MKKEPEVLLTVAILEKKLHQECTWTVGYAEGKRDHFQKKHNFIEEGKMHKLLTVAEVYI